MDEERPSGGKTQNIAQNAQDQPMLEEDEDLDDFDDLAMFHKSSLKDQEQLPLPQRVEELYGIKAYIDANNHSKIGQYIEHEKIGMGAFAQVLKAQKNGCFYAIKIYSKLKLRSQRFFAADGSFANGQQMFRNQINIIKRLNHQNLVNFEQILHGGSYAYVVGELCDLGQIMDWDQMSNNYKRNQKVTQYIGQKYKLETIEDITRVVFLQAALGVQYMHSHNITNRDIKVDNILCRTNNGQGGDIKIADFTTVRYSVDDVSYFPSGTPGFRGPEQQFASSEGYGCKATDVWSLGVSMYTFYKEFFPFMGECELQIDLKAQNTILEFDPNTPSWLTSVINGMTCKNWKERMTIDEVVQKLSKSDEP